MTAASKVASSEAGDSVGAWAAGAGGRAARCTGTGLPRASSATGACGVAGLSERGAVAVLWPAGVAIGDTLKDCAVFAVVVGCTGLP
jgi:hypothetical protein